MSGLPTGDRRFEILVDSISGHGIYMLDADGRVATWNRGAQAMKGWRSDEILGQPFARFFTPEDVADGLPGGLMDQARRLGRVESQGWRMRKDGSRFWVEASLHSLKDDRGEITGFAKITRDMTEQRAAQEALIESERRFRYLVEGVVDYAIYMLDVNGVVTNWNRGAQRIKGYEAGEIIGRHFSTFYTPADRASGLPARALSTALREGRFDGEGRRVRKNGETFWASVVIDPIHDDQGRHIGFAKITRDISERRAAEEALRASERQLSLLVSGVIDYAIYMIDPNGVVTSWNAGAEKIKGYTAQEILGQHVSLFYTPADRAAGLPLRGINAAAAEGRYESEGWRVRKDGTQFWANVVIDAIRDESGALLGFAKVTRDITDRKQAEADLRKAQERIAQASKMEALGQLTGGVAHDFNNLLMVVGGQTQLLRSRMDEPARALRAVEAIDAAVRRGEQLTRHLLSFSRRQKLDPLTAAPGERLSALKDLVLASVPPSIELRVDLPPELWTIEVDQGELELAILNLTVNARDAMPAGGRLTISGRNASLDEDEDGLQGDFVVLTVRDTGTGIAPDILERVFEPFFTTKPVDKGTGLGLSQVFGFAHQAGGEVRVDSRLGAGASFSLYLPRAGEPRSTIAPAERHGAVAAASPANLLLVEDNPEVAEVALGFLEQLGHRVRHVGDAAQALSVVEGDDPPDLVFSDIVMAGDMDGLELARRLRERRPDLPVLLATGYSQAAETIAGEFPILRKPYGLDQLSQALALLLSVPTPDDEPDNLIPLETARKARAASRGRP